MRDRNTQKQLWTDLKFVERLEKIKAKRLIGGQPVKNLGQLTKEMLACPSFQELEKELLGANEIKGQIRIKLDKTL